MNEDIYWKYSWKYDKNDLKYCPKCSNEFSLEDLHIKNQPQLICHKCKFIFYLDPKLVVTAVVLNTDKSKILLLKRAENPGKNLWALVGGYVERGNDVFDTIKSEIFEETGLTVSINGIIQTKCYPNEGIVELFFEAISETEITKINIESYEGKFFDFKSIPYERLAFDTTKEILKLYDKTTR